MFHPKTLQAALKAQDSARLLPRYEAFKHYQSKQNAIRALKEEQYQEGFLRDLFVAALGYTLSPDANANLLREEKNEQDAQKADGAITLEGKIVALIELKDTSTRDFERAKIRGGKSPIEQLFGYLSAHTHARYAILSNFEKLRLYIDKKTEFEEFDLFSIGFAEFKRLHLLLSLESLTCSLPLQLKKQSAEAEAQITKALYRDYADFRRALFEDIVTCNPTHEPKTLLRLTQKLVDRIVFILFAEDTLLLRKNTIREIRERHSGDIHGLGMYDYYKIYFAAIDTGHEKLAIKRYNGGLFAHDALLDSLIISDDRLDMSAQRLSDYDFASDVSIDILGHIFEQSLSDLEEMNAAIEGNSFDAKASKRKKEGVFYTPGYITRYIVENTLGSLCEEKRRTLGIDSQITAPKHRTKLLKAEATTLQALQAYRTWLYGLRICDPACGSGAFLNQALAFLIAEHTRVQAQILLFGDLTAHEEIEKTILEHNLYGVDLNEDACEIARLSLWLSTARAGRELTKLSDKIKSGNSLISDPVVDEHAFDWEAEFPEVFQNGGFDIIVGNPPYVRQELLHVGHKEYFKTRYATYHGAADLYIFFVEKGYSLLRDGGKFGYIFPNKWMRSGYGEALRAWLGDKRIEEIIDFGDLRVFEEATTYPLILTLHKGAAPGTFRSLQMNTLEFGDLRSFVREHHTLSDQNALHVKGWTLGDGRTQALLEKIEQSGVRLGEYVQGEIYRGVLTGLNEAFVIDAPTRARLIDEDAASAQIIKPFLAGRDIKRYETPEAQNYLIFTRRGINIDAYPAVKAHLEQYKERLMPKPKGFSGTWNGRKEGSYEWYELQDTVGYWEAFERPKILYQEIATFSAFTYEENCFFANNKVFILPNASLFLLGILNSKVVWFFLGMTASNTKPKNGL
ncbi:MAG: Eco57I restriction-modification methylase domain-containing protein [Campylobacterales bacterium]|nr:Eco57I restriction-modification methylase domain-containing protein [Campylobacterales bacterium]